MNIKIPEYLLKMPTYLPNDIEGMIFTYPNKFPLIKEKYEEAAKNMQWIQLVLDNMVIRKRQS